MDISVFLSATCKDLADDCRKIARETIEETNAKAITMETWISDYRSVEKVCHEKIRDECSHYLGIFSYRRGWIPPGHSKSITELEFDWADEYKKPRAIFLPNHTSPIALELRRRAKDQSKEDEEAQRSFLEQTRQQGTCIFFQDLIQMSRRIGLKVAKWSEGDSLREIARQKTGESRITENNTLELGRKMQFRQFEDTLDNILSLDLPAVTCFLVFGESGFGHTEMLKRLYHEVENKGSGYPIYIPHLIKPQSNLTEMRQGIGKWIQVNLVPPSVNDLASKLNDCLAENDVVLEIENLQRLDCSIKEFQDQFWEPLVKALGSGFKNKLIVLLGFEGTLEEESEFVQCDPSNLDNFQSHSIVVLDELKKFKQSELTSWLRKWYPSDDAQMLSRTLIAESRGGIPQLLYHKLRELK